MVERGYAKKIVVNKPQGILRMYVKPEHIRDVFKQSTKQTGVDPYLEVEFGSVDYDLNSEIDYEIYGNGIILFDKKSEMKIGKGSVRL